jgi:HEAT repeat protein
MELGEMGLKHLNSNEHSYRDVHIAVLAEARTKGVKKDLLEMLADDEEPERNQLAAARALGALASPEDAAAMDKLAKGNLPDPVKEALAASLKAVRERAEIPKLVNALKVSGEREQVDAISALRDCAADVDPDVFVKVLKTAQNSALREIAAEGLDRMKRPEAMEALLDFADDKSAAVREQIAKSAGTRLSWRAIPVLLRFLKDSEATVRKAAAVALSNLGVVEAVPGLLALLDDPDGDVAQAAGEALKQITREPMPFDSRWPEKERKEAIQNWRKWWEK